MAPRELMVALLRGAPRRCCWRASCRGLLGGLMARIETFGRFFQGGFPAWLDASEARDLPGRVWLAVAGAALIAVSTAAFALTRR